MVIQLTEGTGIAAPRHSIYPCPKPKGDFGDKEKKSKNMLAHQEYV
jgi:hypothetical protein